MQDQASSLLSSRRNCREPQRALRLLLEELTQRVAGEFAAAIATLSRAATLAEGEGAQNALSAVQCRLENFARVHAALRVPEFRTTVDGRSYLRRLCSAIDLSSLQFRGIGLECLGKSFEIDTEQCWRLGMIVSQLVRVAAGHSFVSVPARIWVAAARRGALVWCQVADNGIDENEGADSRAMGIVDALARELHGGFELRRRSEGCIATVIFPAERT